MEITVQHDEAMIVTVRGRLDTNTAPELDEAIKKETISENAVVVDFAGVEYISSAGLRVLLALKRELDGQGKSLEIRNINAVVREIFNVTGFINVLTVK